MDPSPSGAEGTPTLPPPRRRDPGDPDATLPTPPPAPGSSPDVDVTAFTPPPPAADPNATVPPPPAADPNATVPPPPPAAAERAAALWAATLAANPGARDPGLTLKAPPAGAAPGPDTEARLGSRVGVEIAQDDAVGDGADYVVEERLAQGGMGAIFRARQRTFGRDVALKRVLPHLEGRPEVEERFLAEALVTGRLEHPNIVPVHDLGRASDGRLYMGMKLVRGETLADLLAREPPTTPERLRRVLEVLQRVCDALAYAHSEGVLHRDLKPSNVMVGAFGEVQLMDWGLAATTEEVRAAAGGGPAGTPCWMSPEQANDEVDRIGPAADVYLLGGMLYAALTGTAPHRGGSLISVLAAACRGEVEPPSERAPDREVPADLEDLCRRALDPDPARRPESAAAFGDALARHLTHAEALRLIHRARRLLGEGEAGRRTAELVRAETLLGQALELWPESEEARADLNRARYLQADLALERGEARAADELVARLEPGPGLDEARLQSLRQAVRRQRTRRRNQLVTAVVTGVAALGLYGLWAEAVGRRIEGEADAAEARAEVPRVAGEAWEALREPDGAAAAARALGRLDSLERRAGADYGPGPALRLAVAWDDLRRGDPDGALDRAGDLLGGRRRRELVDALRERARAGDPRGAAARWREASAGAGTASTAADRSAAALVEAALLLVDGGRVIAPGPLPDARGLPVVRGDPRSGLAATLADREPSLVVGLEGAIRPGLEVSGRGEAGRRRLVVVAREVGPGPGEGRVRWRFPPAPPLDWAGGPAEPHPPMVVRGPDGALRVAVARGSEVLFLDPTRGVVVARRRLHDRVAGLLPAGEGGVLVAQQAGRGRGRALLLPASAEGWGARPVAGDDLRYRHVHAQRELGRWVVDPADERPEDHPARLRDELARLDACAAWDPTHPYLEPMRVDRLLRLGGDPTPGLAARLVGADLSAWELSLEAERLEAAHGVARVGSLTLALADAAVTAWAREGANPGIAPGLSGSPALLLRKMAARAGESGDMERGRRLLDLSREVSAVVEGDGLVLLPLERRWLERRGRTDELAALGPYAERARLLGGVLGTPVGVAAGFDVALLVLWLVPVLLVLAGGAAALRTAAARREALRELGFRTAWSRVAGFATHPVLRVSHTFLAYLPRRQRLVFLALALLGLAALVYAQAALRALSVAAEAPFVLLGGRAGHPNAEEVLRAAGRSDDPGTRAAALRLRCEGRLMRGERTGELWRLLEELDAITGGDAFAANNSGLLLEGRGEREAALGRYAEAGASPGPAGAVGRYNAARLRGQPLPELPVVYRAYRRLGPERPMRQLAPTGDLLAALGVAPSPGRAFAAELAAIAGGGRRLLTFVSEDLGGGRGFFSDVLAGPALSPTTILEPGLLQGRLLLLALFVLVHLPFPARREDDPPGPRARRGLAVAGQLGNLVLPGTLWLARGRLRRGCLAAALGPFLVLLAVVGARGGLLHGVTLAAGPSPYPTASDAPVPLSEGMRTAAGLARVLLVGLYGAAWAHGVWALVGWARRRRATAGPPPASDAAASRADPGAPRPGPPGPS